MTSPKSANASIKCPTVILGSDISSKLNTHVTIEENIVIMKLNASTSN